MGKPGRLIFDIGVSTRRFAPPSGIVRREQALARYALKSRPDIRFVLFDWTARVYREVRREWAGALIRSDTVLESGAATFSFQRQGWRRHLPSRLLMSLALEERRLQALSERARCVVASAQHALCWPHGLPAPLVNPDGSRRNVVPARDALKDLAPLGPEDTILSVGNYTGGHAGTIAALKRQQGFRYVSMRHDLIVVSHPQYFVDEHVAGSREHWHTILPMAERILVNSRTVERELCDYCRAQGIALRDVARVRPGSNLAGLKPAAKLPAGLRPGRYALFVATIEPRKGHAMMLDVWQRLVEKGVPQRRGYKLVIVGSPGWKTTDLQKRLADPVPFAGTLLHLTGAGDGLLARLYRDCAFGLLPSICEGFGMPLIESFACGRTMIVSTGGSLPEIAGPFAPCLAPTDQSAWQAMLERWIEDDAARAPYEAAIRDSFRPVSWDQAAAEIFAAAEAPDR